MRNDRWLKVLALLLVGIVVSAIALAGPKANPRRGKVFYKKNCRVCHDGSTGEAELSPISKIMEQWNRAFQPGAIVSECVPRVKEKVGTELTDQDLLDMQAYLVQHAADSDQPASCGN